jgi:serine/threonine protein kinase
MSELPASARIGQVIDGKYRVQRIIGAGGMGIVVAAEHLQLGRIVALKFLLEQACENPEAVSRFLREGRALAQISSEHVARVMDVGTLEQGQPYLVLEYLEGRDLSLLLKELGQLPLALAVDYVLQAAEAVAEAHANGIIHRDLKPSNLFLTEGTDGEPLIKVLDFGISKAILPKSEQSRRVEADATTAAAGHDTNTGALVGSPLYMSPEQIRSARRVDERTDIWGFGVVLYELLCGRRPFGGETLTGTLAAVAADPPQSMRTLRADLPAELEAVVLRCLEKSPDQRFDSLAGLARALQRFAAPGALASVERIERRLGRSSKRVAHAAAHEVASEERAATVPTWEGKAAALTSSQVFKARWPLLLGVTLLALVWALVRPGPAATNTVSSVTRQTSAAAAPLASAPPAPLASVPPAPLASVPPAPLASVPPAPLASAPPNSTGFSASSLPSERPRSANAPRLRPEPGRAKPAEEAPARPSTERAARPVEPQDGTADRK